jgi:hypothetical protein
MIYGDVASAVAGFLLTASTNWTGRLPVNGYPLAALFALWLVGRIGIAVSAICGLLPAVVIDVAFLLIFAGVALNEIIAGRNWRNRARRADHRQYRFSRGGHSQRQRGLRHPYRHCRTRWAHRAGRRTDRAELHPQLAGAKQSGPLPQPFSRFDAVKIGRAHWR